MPVGILKPEPPYRVKLGFSKIIQPVTKQMKKQITITSTSMLQWTPWRNCKYNSEIQTANHESDKSLYPECIKTLSTQK